MPQPPQWAQAIGREVFLRHLRDIRSVDRELATALQEAAREADQIVRASIPDGVGAAVRRAQYQQSAFLLRRSQADLWQRVTRTLTVGLEDSSRLAVVGTMKINEVLAKAVGIDTNLGTSFLFSARSAAENVRSRLMSEIPLSNRVYRTQALSNRWVQRTINKGIALNKSAAEIAADVRSLIRPDVRGGVTYAARRLARTELNNAFHATSIRNAEEMPWMVGQKWNLSNSHSRPDECEDYANGDHDGLGKGVFKSGSVPRKPHPQCLCFLTTVSVEPEDFAEAFLAGRYDRYLSTAV